MASKLDKMFSAFRKKAGEREVYEFENGGYKTYQDTIEKQNRQIGNILNSGKSVDSNLLSQYEYNIARFKRLSVNSGMNNTVKQQFLNSANYYQNNISSFTKLSDINKSINTAKGHADSIYKKFQTGAPVDSQSFSNLKYAIDNIWAQAENAPENTKQQLIDIAKKYQDFYRDFDDINNTIIEQQGLRKERDKAENEKTAGYITNLINSLRYQNATAAERDDIARVTKNFDADKYDVRINRLKNRINENYGKYVPLLDREVLKSALDDGSLTGKAHDYTNEDYEAASEYKKASIAAEQIKKNNEVKEIADAGGQEPIRKLQERKF